jgi:hypothetical protein
VKGFVFLEFGESVFIRRFLSQGTGGIDLEAYIIVNSEPSKVWAIVECIRQIDGVRQSHAVAGRFDAIAYAEFEKVEDLGRIIIDVQSIKGVTSTQSLLVIPPALKEIVETEVKSKSSGKKLKKKN